MRTFDFGAVAQPQLAVTLRGGVKVHLELPTVALVEMLQAEAPKLCERVTSRNLAALHRYYDILAELLEYNAEGLHFTVEELETKYRITMQDMVAFYSAYMEFIDEVRSAKN